MNKNKLTAIAEEYIDLVQQAKEIETRIKELEKSLKPEINEGDALVIGGLAVRHVGQDRRSFDAIALKDLVSPALFKKITEVSVKASAVDSAIELGSIDPEIVQSVTEVKHSSYLKVVANKP